MKIQLLCALSALAICLASCGPDTKALLAKEGDELTKEEVEDLTGELDDYSCDLRVYVSDRDYDGLNDFVEEKGDEIAEIYNKLSEVPTDNLDSKAENSIEEYHKAVLKAVSFGIQCEQGQISYAAGSSVIRKVLHWFGTLFE